jgi:hypothetical protein
MANQLKDYDEDVIIKIKFDTEGSEPLSLNLYGHTDKGHLLLKNSQIFNYKNTNGTLNPICDLDGKGNTDILIKNDISLFAAAEACVNYSTDYSPAGTWYLPAAGELCYILSRWYIIQQTLYMLNNTDKIAGCSDKLHSNGGYWSST